VPKSKDRLSLVPFVSWVALLLWLVVLLVLFVAAAARPPDARDAAAPSTLLASEPRTFSRQPAKHTSRVALSTYTFHQFYDDKKDQDALCPYSGEVLAW